jgi:hypothetical protein
LRILAALPLLAAAPQARAQVGLGMSPMRVEVQAAPGALPSGALSLTNDAGEAVRVRAELLDFHIDASGTPQFARDHPPEAPSSCRQWLSVNPMETELGPKGKLAARYTVRVPKDAPAREFHCAIGYTTLPTADKTAGMGIRSAVRMVAAFYVTTGASKSEPEITDLRIEKVPSAQAPAWQAVAVFRNKGLAHFRPTGQLRLLDPAGAVVETLTLPSLPVLPEREQRIPLPLKSDLSSGRYTLQARVDLGTGDIQEATLQYNADAAPAAR